MTRKIEKSTAEWLKQLTPEQFQVARQKGTEPAFSGKFHDNKVDGVYTCVCCNESLFDSRQKYDSGSGWPSFYQATDPEAIEEEADNSHGMVRREVLCDACGAHLGHVFPDGPQPSGQRYCINSASLDFVKRDTEGDAS